VFSESYDHENIMLIIFRLQLVWSTIFSHGSAYLSLLEITRSQSSLIWAIAPLCGVFIQPIVGAMSDNSRSRWGRRRPFLLGGAIATAISFLALAFISDIIYALADFFSVYSPSTIKIWLQFGTIICITLLNISIQPLQSGLRSLIIDICPKQQQSTASAWAGRFTGIGNILGYVLGSLPLGDSEVWRFRLLSLVSVITLITTVLITVFFIHEDEPREYIYELREESFLLRAIRGVRNGWSAMSSKSRRICSAQFFSWMGWFGFLFYSTSYIGRLYLTESRKFGIEHFEDAGIRVGTFASLLSAITAFVTTLVVPQLALTASRDSFRENPICMRQIAWWRQTHIIWTMSHLLYVLCIFATVFISSTEIAIAIITITGISWGVTQWAPFALLGNEIAIYQDEKAFAIEGDDKQSTTNQSGAIMGIHNAAISIPQIFAALGSSLIFLISRQIASGEEDGIAWVLRCSGLAAIVAAYLSWHLR
jgi:solute carrier family 45 protein 1/2/4